MRKYNFKVEFECHSAGTPNLTELEKLLSLHMEDLLHDDTVFEALNETEAITIQVTLL